MSGLIPSSHVLDSWASLDDACQWAGLSQGVVRSWARQLGDANLSSLQVIAVMPMETLRLAMNNAVRGGVALTEIEKAQLTLLINAVKAKFGIAFTGLTGGVADTANSSRPAHGAASPSQNKVKIKLSQVIDQGSDAEVEQLPHGTLQQLRQKYVLVEGDVPLESEEVTDSQLTCLDWKLSMDLPPFVDMGVWGPYGDRLARQMKFVNQTWRDGAWKTVEVPGASSYDAWLEAWRIFRTAAIMLEMATSAVLDRYAAEFKQRIQQHPGVWHLAAQADIRCRSEFWGQERRRQEAFRASHPQMSAYNPKQPWNSVIKASACSSEFWDREFTKPAMLYQMNGPRSMPAFPSPPTGPGFGPGAGSTSARDGGQTSRKRPFDPQRKDGRYFKSRSGVNICFDWAWNPDGCDNEKCKREMAHCCEFCRGPHRTIDCPQVPGWKPPDKNSEKPKGRGRGKGRGRTRQL